jgi:hypothetical protein
MKNLPVAIAIAFVLAGPSGARAHDGVADHGGVLNTNRASEVSLELVAAKGKLTLYLEDHDGLVATKGAKGTLSVIRDGSTKTVSLAADGDNKIVAEGVMVVSGDRITATLQMPNGTAIMGRFVIK